MPAVDELIAHGRTELEIQQELGCDWLIYQDLADLIDAVQKGNPSVTQFDTSCFDKVYVTGDIDQDYLDNLGLMRSDQAKSLRDGAASILEIHNVA
jgi:amidophosphoribosyltransferase